MITNNLIILILQIILLVLSIIINKYSTPKSISEAEVNKINLELLEKYAAYYVAWAAEFYNKVDGNTKMKVVINQLTSICKKYNIEAATEELRAIVQKVYDEYIDKIPEVIPVITKSTVDEDGEEVAIIMDENMKLVK